MVVGKTITRFIGWSFIIAGIIMRFTNAAIEGRAYSRGRWKDNVLDYKALIFFGLVFLVAHYYAYRVKRKKATRTDN